MAAVGHVETLPEILETNNDKTSCVFQLAPKWGVYICHGRLVHLVKL
jgi:hypothetical protein